MTSRIALFVRLSAHKTKFGSFSQKEGYLSNENLFKPSNRKDCRGVVLVEVLKKTGISMNVTKIFHIAFAIPAQRISAIWVVCILWWKEYHTENSREMEAAHEKIDENNNWNFPAPTSPSEALGREFAVKPTDLASAICSSIKLRRRYTVDN